jgi:type II secretory pathway predicted ATPase ExeA
MTHLTETRTVGKTDQQRISHILTERWIGYPKAQDILSNMQDLMEHPKTHRMPNMLLVAPTNNGKTILLQRFFDAYKPRVTTETAYLSIPVVYIQAPPTPNEKAFYINILSALNAPYLERATSTQLQMQVLRILQTVRTHILIIDEIHHILAGSYLSQRAFLNLIKYISNELKICIIGSGIRDAYSAINADKQLANRFEPNVLPNWKLDADYFRLLKSYETMFCLKNPSNITNEETAIKILSMSGGTIGEISTVLKKAAIMAIKTGHERIDLSIIKKINYIGPAHRAHQYDKMLV